MQRPDGAVKVPSSLRVLGCSGGASSFLPILLAWSSDTQQHPGAPRGHAHPRRRCRLRDLQPHPRSTCSRTPCAAPDTGFSTLAKPFLRVLPLVPPRDNVFEHPVFCQNTIVRGPAHNSEHISESGRILGRSRDILVRFVTVLRPTLAWQRAASATGGLPVRCCAAPRAVTHSTCPSLCPARFYALTCCIRVPR